MSQIYNAGMDLRSELKDCLSEMQEDVAPAYDKAEYLADEVRPRMQFAYEQLEELLDLIPLDLKHRCASKKVGVQDFIANTEKWLEEAKNVSIVVVNEFNDPVFYLD